MVVFPLTELPEMGRGQGVQIQRYRDGGPCRRQDLPLRRRPQLGDGRATGRTRTETDLSAWRTARGAAGRMPPVGFPRDNKF
jgi:topoisomerase-4 subunit A